MKLKTIIILLILVNMAAAINFDFYSPTPPNNSIIDTIPQNITVYGKIDLKGNALAVANYTWQGVNNPLYNGDLILYYNMDNVSELSETNLVVKDAGLNSNHATVTNAYSISNGRYNGAFIFDGTGDYINISNPANFPFEGNAFSYQVWFSTVDAGGAEGANGNAIISWGNPSQWNLSGLRVYNSGLLFSNYNSNTNGGGDVDDGIWHHVALVYNTSEIMLYLDGAKVDTTTDVIHTPESNVLIGRQITSTTEDFNGTIDEVRVWNRGLSDSEVTHLYLSNLNKYNSTTFDFQKIQEVTENGQNIYSLKAIDNQDKINQSTFYLYVNTTNYTRAASVSVCEPNEREILSGNEDIINTYYTKFTYGLDTGWFTLNGTNINSSKAFEGYNFLPLMSGGLVGNYSLHCLINDTENQQTSLFGGYINIITTTTTTTTTLPILRTGNCLVGTDALDSVFCYQETATSSTACGGLATGSYSSNEDENNPEYAYDGAWNTAWIPGNNMGVYFNINYTKPSFSNFGSIWSIGNGNATTFYTLVDITNITILENCWDASSSIIELRLNGSFDDFGAGGHHAECYNGSNWVVMVNNFSFGQTFLFEEGIYWNMTINQTYNYSLAFKEEESGNDFNFTKHVSSYLDVICPTYGSDRIPVSGDMDILTRERPTINSIIDNGQQIRQRKLTEYNGSIEIHLLETNGSIIRFDLYDYTVVYANSLLQVKTNVNGTEKTINYGGWDMNNQMSFSLLPNTPYTFTLDSQTGSIREYGYISIGESDTVKTIIVNVIGLNDKNFDNYAGLTYGFQANTSRILLAYNKSRGYITEIAYNVTYAVNNSLAYETTVYETTDGIIFFDVPNSSLSYVQTAYFKLDNGVNITANSLMMLFNGTIPYAFIPEANTELWGIKRITLMNMLGIIFIGAIFTAGTVWNPEIALIGVGLGVILTTMNIMNGIPMWLWTLLFLMALGLKLSQGRPQPV